MSCEEVRPCAPRQNNGERLDYQRVRPKPKRPSSTVTNKQAREHIGERPSKAPNFPEIHNPTECKVCERSRRPSAQSRRKIPLPRRSSTSASVRERHAKQGTCKPKQTRDIKSKGMNRRRRKKKRNELKTREAVRSTYSSLYYDQSEHCRIPSAAGTGCSDVRYAWTRPGTRRPP